MCKDDKGGRVRCVKVVKEGVVCNCLLWFFHTEACSSAVVKVSVYFHL